MRNVPWQSVDRELTEDCLVVTASWQIQSEVASVCVVYQVRKLLQNAERAGSI